MSEVNDFMGTPGIIVNKSESLVVHITPITRGMPSYDMIVIHVWYTKQW